MMQVIGQRSGQQLSGEDVEIARLYLLDGLSTEATEDVFFASGYSARLSMDIVEAAGVRIERADLQNPRSA